MDSKMMLSNNFVNLGEIEGIPHLELFEEVSKVIAEDTLEYVNAHCKKVVPKDSFYTRYGKRCVDIIFSTVALCVTFPINLIIAICTYFDVGQPIIFKQERVGRMGKLFTIYKFRNMTNETDEHGILLPPSQRVTRFGRFVRKTSLDELLNFWSIFKGDMSLIGPRPLPPEYNDFYNVRHKMRYAVRPGLECPIIHSTEDKITWNVQFENDIYYVENISFLLDIKMIIALFKLVFSKKSSAIRGNAVRGSFMGYHRNGTSINSQKVEEKYYKKALERMGYTISNND